MLLRRLIDRQKRTLAAGKQWCISELYDNSFAVVEPFLLLQAVCNSCFVSGPANAHGNIRSAQCLRTDIGGAAISHSILENIYISLAR